MPEQLKPVLARQMEVYAGFLEHTDHHIGRLIDTLEDLGVLDDTLIYYIIGDNGASAEGTLNGTFNEMSCFNGAGGARDAGVPEAQIDELADAERLQPLCGRLGACDGHAVSVDKAGRVALGRHPQRHDRALAERDQRQGRDPIAVPPRDRRRADRPGRCRRCQSRRWSTASAGADGRRQHAYSFDDGNAAERHETQYFEMFCNRGIYHKGWTRRDPALHAMGVR